MKILIVNVNVVSLTNLVPFEGDVTKCQWCGGVEISDLNWDLCVSCIFTNLIKVIV